MEQSITYNWASTAHQLHTIIFWLETESFPRLSTNDLDCAKEYLDYNELGLAFDYILDTIDSQKIAINVYIFSLIQSAGVRMGHQPITWQGLHVAEF